MEDPIVLQRTPGRLVTWGIYAISRHPIYLFFNLYFLGTFLINGTLIFLLFALVIAGNLHLQILNEEEFLQRTYGRAYQEYCLRTYRYLGQRRHRPIAAAPGQADPPQDPPFGGKARGCTPATPATSGDPCFPGKSPLAPGQLSRRKHGRLRGDHLQLDQLEDPAVARSMRTD